MLLQDTLSKAHPSLLSMIASKRSRYCLIRSLCSFLLFSIRVNRYVGRGMTSSVRYMWRRRRVQCFRLVLRMDSGSNGTWASAVAAGIAREIWGVFSRFVMHGLIERFSAILEEELSARTYLVSESVIVDSIRADILRNTDATFNDIGEYIELIDEALRLVKIISPRVRIPSTYQGTLRCRTQDSHPVVCHYYLHGRLRTRCSIGRHIVPE